MFSSSGKCQSCPDEPLYLFHGFCHKCWMAVKLRSVQMGPLEPHALFTFPSSQSYDRING